MQQGLELRKRAMELAKEAAQKAAKSLKAEREALNARIEYLKEVVKAAKHAEKVAIKEFKSYLKEMESKAALAESSPTTELRPIKKSELGLPKKKATSKKAVAKTDKKRGRGRPPKTEASSATAGSKVGENIPKSTEVKATTHGLKSEIEKPSKAKSTVAPTDKKRGPGRPKKVEPIETTSSSPVIKRGRGRPPKPKAVLEGDDLTQLTRLGDRVMEVMYQYGIKTFEDMANTSVERLREILRENNMSKFRNPAPWPAEAKKLAEKKQR